jgi:MFS family permease
MGFTLLTPILSTRIEVALGESLAFEVPFLDSKLDLEGSRSLLLGLNLALGGLANLIAIPLVPGLVARFGGRAVAVACALGLAACMAGFAVTELWIWFPLRFVFHMCLGTLFVITEYWLLSDAPARFRGRVIGIYGTCLGLGLAIGPSILQAATALSLNPFYACMVLFVAASCVIAAKTGSRLAVDHRDTWMILKVFRADPAVVLAGFMFGLFEFGAGSLLINFAMRVGYSMEDAIVALSLLYFSNVCFQIPIGILSDRFNRRTLLFLIAVIGLVGAGALLVGHVSSLGFFVLVFFWSGSMAGLYTVGLAQSASLFEEKNFVHVNSCFVVSYSAGMIVGPLLLGLGMDIWNPFGFAYCLIAVFAAYAMLLAASRPKVSTGAVELR